MNLTTLSPAEIDAIWAPLATETNRLFWKSVDTRAEISKLRDSAESGNWRAKFELDRADRLEASLPKLAEAHQAAEKAEEPYRTEWTRRGGWTRAYLVITNGDGHVHCTMNCGTCFPTTQFNWITEFSGQSEQEIVDAAGERACTVCYKSAPVALRLDRPTTIVSEDEKARKVAREERAAKKAKAAAEAITVENFYDHSDYTHTHTFKTTRGATNAIADRLGSLVWYSTTHPSARQWISDIDGIREALKVKGIEYDYDKALAAARKKAVREGGQAKY